MSEAYKELLSEYKHVTTQRAPWEPVFQELREYIHPEASDFNRQASRGQVRSHRIDEGTAPWACEQFASGLGAFITPRTSRWARPTVLNYDISRNRNVLQWLETTVNILFHQYSFPRSNFYSALHEVYLDLGSLGTGVLLQFYDWKTRRLKFKAIPLSDVFILENNDGIIDTVYRTVCWTTRQVKQQFSRPGDFIPKKIFEEKNEHKVWEVVHVVKPRTDRNASKFDVKNKRYASVWFCEAAKSTDGDPILRESGMDFLPYHVVRWFTRSGEVYGRGPGHTCLPDIRMINTMERTQIRSAQKQADPPLLAPSDGFVLPLKTAPASMMYYDPALSSVEHVKTLETRGRYDIGEDKMGQKREHILRCFYADWITRNKKKERQTQVEIMDDRQEMINLMGPNIARIETELIYPMMALSYNLLDRAGQLPPAPQEIQDAELSIEFTSPAAQAQEAQKGISTRRWITEEIIPYAQIKPDILDWVNEDEWAKESARLAGATVSVVNSSETVRQIRQGREQMAQAQQMAETMQPAAAALKDVATAKEKGLNVIDV